MKRFLSLILAFVFVIGVCASAPVTIKANAANIDDLTFELSNDNTFYIVTACNKEASGKIVIPETYNNLPVKSIGESAFARCASLTEIYIPDSVITIERSAFMECSQLCDIRFSNKIKTIEGALLGGCSSIESIEIPVGVTRICFSAFSLCESLKNITIPDTVTRIDSGAFYCCSRLKSIVIPDSVTYLASNEEGDLFSGCVSLKEVKLSKNITKIGGFNFYECRSLENIEIPDSVTEIYDGAFRGCDSLKNLTVPTTVLKIGSKAFGYKSFGDDGLYEDVTITGESLSIAEKYANENGITFISNREHQHKYESKILKEPTCEKQGEKLLECFCGDFYTETLSVKEHKIEDNVNYKKVTCTEDGYTGDVGCVNCDKIVSKGSVVKAKGHNFEKEYTKDVPSESEYFTTKSRKCTRCNAKKCVQDVPPLSSKLSKYDMKTFDYAVIEDRELAWISGNLQQGVYLYDTLDLLFDNSDIMYDVGFAFGEYVNDNPVFYGLEVTGYQAWMGRNLGIIFKVPSLSKYNELVKKREATHNSGDWVVERKATKDQCGIKVRKCKDCGITIEMRAIQKIVTKLATPSVKVANLPNGIKISWDHIYDAEKYIVYRRTYNASTKQWGSWSAIKKNYLGTTYTDTTGKNGTTYQYTVRAVNRDVKSSYKASASVKCQPTLTTKTEITAQGIKVTWTADKTAESYVVYRRTYDAKTKKYSGWTSIKTINKTSYLDTTVTLGTIYSYTVKAVNGNAQCKSTATKNVTYDSIPDVSIAMASNGIKVSWSTVVNATGYTVYRSEYNPKTESWSKWVNCGTAKANKTAWTDTKVKSGVCYKYTVRARYNSAASSYYKFVDEIVYLTQPTVKIANASTGMKVSWNKIAGATGYTIYRQEFVNGKWTGWKNLGTIKKGSTISWVDKSVKSGTTYRYTVRAVNNQYVDTYKSTYTASSGLLYLAQPKTTVKAVSNGINVAWTQSTGATSYTIYRIEYNSKTKKWSGWKNMGTANKDKKSWVDKSAKKGVTYKYTVKAVNGKTASSYAASGTVKR